MLKIIYGVFALMLLASTGLSARLTEIVVLPLLPTESVDLDLGLIPLLPLETMPPTTNSPCKEEKT